MSIAASIIASTLNAGTPLLIAAAGIVIHEKSGVLNLGIEGIMLMGAVTGFTVTLSTGSFALGFLAGAGVGILLGLLFAFFTLGMHANQYAAGLALSLFGAGLSAFIGKPLQGQALAERSVSGIPGLENIPFFGEAFFSQHILVYGAWVLIAAVWYFLFRTRAGLVLRAVGESPQSAFALGYPVLRIRLFAVLFGALCSGVACLFVVGLYAALGRRHDGRPRVDCIGTGDFCNLAAAARGCRRLPFRRRDDAAVRLPGDGHFHFAAVHGNDALSRDDSRACADFPEPRLDSPQRSCVARQTFFA